MLTSCSTVAVTGSSGKLGRHVVAHLADHGHRRDRAGPRTGPARQAAAAFVRVDLTDYGQVLEALHGVDERTTGVDAVVHLAAIPAPGLATNAATFDNNITSTYHVFAAARRAGHQQRRLGVQRDRAGAAVRHPAAVPAGRRGVPARPESRLLAGQDARGKDGRASSAAGIRSCR